MSTENKDQPGDETRSGQANGCATIEWHDGIPGDDGYYLVELKPGVVGNKTHDVDYCRAKSGSDGGGREWATWYAHNVAKWAHLPVASHNEAAERRAQGKEHNV